MLKYSFFSIFLLSFLAFQSSNAKPLVINDQTLNAITISPCHFGVPGLFKTIPDWFAVIQNKGFPIEGNILCAHNPKQPYWHFNKGLPSGLERPIFIHSGPRDDTIDRLINGRTGHAFRCTNAWIKYGLINGPLICYDYFFDATEFDLGQGLNVNAFGHIYSQTTQANPKAPLIIASTCIGAKIALEYASCKDTSNIKAMILESPFINPHRVLANWAKKYAGWVPFASKKNKDKGTKKVVSWYFPALKRALKIPHANVSNINPTIPLFIAHLQNDSFYSDQDMFDLIQELRKSGNKNIYLLVIQDPLISHGHLNNKKCFINAVSAFLAVHNLPHNQEQALQGQDLLAAAAQNAVATTITQWKIAVS